MENLFDFLPAEMEYWGIPGFSYGVMKDGKVIAKGGYGYRAVSYTHLNRTGSISGRMSPDVAFQSGIWRSATGNTAGTGACTGYASENRRIPYRQLSDDAE